MSPLREAATLPCGAVAPNRLAKAAMTEGLAEPGGRAGARIARAYQAWAEGGPGLILTGNVMIDRRYLERPANVAVDGPQDAAARAGLEAWAEACKARGALALVQLSHAGRQSPRIVAAEPVGPSAVPVRLPGGVFAPPRALTGEEIEDVAARFAAAAATVCEAGFDGVQVHAAHGYLISEFLSPLANRREDRWGGSLENRARLLLDTVRAVRAAIAPGKALSVKLNASDFQKGGFSFEECLEVVARIEGEGVDLIEISGGNYEQPRMMGMEGLEPVFEAPVRESTRRREAYFLEYAAQVRRAARIPVMVTGGLRTRAAMEAATTEDGVAILGVARPLCVEPDLPARLLAGEIDAFPAHEARLQLGPGPLGRTARSDLGKALNGLAVMAFFYRNILRLGDGRPTRARMNLLGALIAHQLTERADARRIAGR